MQTQLIVFMSLEIYIRVYNNFSIIMPTKFSRITRRLSLVEQELLNLPEHKSSPPSFSGIRVAQSLCFRVVFCRWLFVLLSPFSYGHCIFCPSMYSLVSSNFSQILSSITWHDYRWYICWKYDTFRDVGIC